MVIISFGEPRITPPMKVKKNSKNKISRYTLDNNLFNSSHLKCQHPKKLSSGTEGQTNIITLIELLRYVN